MRRVLMISYYFPPLGGIAALRALGFAEHLPSFGWEATVLAPSNGAYHRDPSLSVPPGKTTRTWSLELSRLGKHGLRAGGDDTRPAMPGPVRSLARDLARRWHLLPRRPDWLVSRGGVGRTAPGPRGRVRRDLLVVGSDHRPSRGAGAASQLRAFRGSPSSEIRGAPGSPAMPLHSCSGHGRLERSIASEASAVVMTSPSWAREHSARWGREVITIPNGFGLRTAAHPRRSDELVVGFLGTYYPAARTCRRFGRRWPGSRRIDASPPVRLRVVGDVPAGDARGATSGGDRVVARGDRVHAV